MTGRVVNIYSVPITIPNNITNETPDFYISYNDRDKTIYGDVTTALVTNSPVKFLILNGNHTEQYNQIISNGGNYNDCVQYYKDNEISKSKYSED